MSSYLITHPLDSVLLRSRSFLRQQDRPIGSRWVFLVKRKADGSIDRYKGRVVAQGFSQRPGFDFTETWAPTAKMASIRAILATAGFEDWDIEQVDISSAFLNGDLEEDITMKVFDGLRQIYEYRACEVSLFCGHTKSVAVALHMLC